MNIKRKLFVILIIIFSTFTLCTGVEGTTVINDNQNTTNMPNNKSMDSICKYKEGEVILTYKKSLWNSTINLSTNSIFSSYTVDDTSEFEGVRINQDNSVNNESDNTDSSTLAISLVKSEKHTTKELIDIFKEKDWVISVEPNYIIKTSSLTNDTYEKYQWAIENSEQNNGKNDFDINPISTSSDKEKVIAIIDTGVDYTHEDLKNVMWINPYSKKELKGIYGYDFANGDEDPMDDNLHGTHVAGIISAEANNNAGVTGAVLSASNIKIMALKVLGKNGESDDLYRIIKAYNYIYKAQKLGTNIVAINNSWGGFGIADDEENLKFFGSLESVINLVGENGAISVCAAGNDSIKLDQNGSAIFDAHDIFYDDIEAIEKYADRNYQVCLKEFPAGLNSKYIISVAAINQHGQLADFSNYGESIDISAPGTNILSSVTNWTEEDEEERYSRKNFIPSIYTQEQLENTCDEYWNFENCTNEDIPFTANKGQISITEDMSFGTGKKCLKWEFDILESDVNKKEIEYPELVFNKEYDWYGWISGMFWGESDGNDLDLSCCTKYVRIDDNTIVRDGSYSLYKYNQKYWCQFGQFSGTAWSEAKHMDYGSLGIEDNPLKDYHACGKLRLVSMADNPGHYVYYIDDFAISNRKTEDEILIPYSFLDGTSMAAPFVTGAAGTLSNLYENDNALQRKERILSCTKKSESLSDVGGILDLSRNYKKISEINIAKKPNKTVYIEGEDIDITGGKIEVTFEDGVKQDIKMKKNMISGYNKNTLGKQIIYINYKEKKAIFEVYVTKKVLNLEIKSLPNKLNYIKGEELDLTGLKIEVTYEDGNKEELKVEEYMISGYEKNKVDVHTITVNYGGKTVTFEVTVKNEVVGIRLKNLPYKLTYVKGEELDITGGKLELLYEDGSIEEINILIEMVFGYDKTKVGEQILKVDCCGYTVTFKVYVTKNISNIEIKSIPSKLTYVKGEELDMTGGKIEVTYQDGSKEEIEMTADMITGYDKTKVGEQELAVNYKGKTATFKVKITNNVTKISIKNLPKKLTYVKGEELDMTGGKIEVTYQDGSKEEIEMTADMITGYDKTKVGEQELAVNYKGKTATFKVNVESIKLFKIEIANQPNKLTYNEGEKFNAEGIKVIATYNNGEKKDVTKEVIVNDNILEYGTTEIIISYTENNITKTTVQKITVIEKLKVRFNSYTEVIKYNKKYLSNINPNTTLEEIKSSTNTNGKVKFYKGEDEITDLNIKASTGMKYKIMLNDEMYEAVMVIKGDINGDGEIDFINDIIRLNNYRLNKIDLDTEYILAGDINGNGEINFINDIIRLNNYRLNKIKSL